MTKIQQCKGAADFLKITWEYLYKPRCIDVGNYHSPKECFKEVHKHYGEMAETYASFINLDDKSLNKCFTKPASEVLQEIASYYENSEDDYDYPDEDLEYMEQADKELDEKYRTHATDVDDWDENYLDEEDYDRAHGYW